LEVTMMQRVILVAAVLLATAVLPASSQVGRDRGEVVPVTVTNFPDLVRVEGTVSVEGPIDHTTLRSLTEVVVPPVRRDDFNHLVDAGQVMTDGFASVVLSLVGELKGPSGRSGEVGVVLVPEEERVLRALNERGQFLLPLEVTAEPTPGSPYFAGESKRFAVAYPRYRALLYNHGERTVSVTVHAYLTD
jgi:hypothetical protein